MTQSPFDELGTDRGEVRADGRMTREQPMEDVALDSRALSVDVRADWGSTDLALSLRIADGQAIGLRYLGGYSAGSEMDALARDTVSLIDLVLRQGIAPGVIEHSMSARELYDGTSLPGSMLAAIVMAIGDEIARP